MTGGARLGHRDSEVRKEKKIGHRRVTEEGTVTYKKVSCSRLKYLFFDTDFCIIIVHSIASSIHTVDLHALSRYDYTSD